jgi:hypothetical protein
MAVTGQQGYKWNNATQGLDGQIVYLSAAGVADYTTGVTQVPEGVLSNKPKQYETAQVQVPQEGDIVAALVECTVGIAVGDPIMSNSTGRGVKAAKNGTYVTTFAWIIGHAVEAAPAGAGDRVIGVRWSPQEGSYVAGS